MSLPGVLCAAPEVEHSSVVALRAQAERGIPEAQTELALKYEYGEGERQDLGKALKLLCEAAKRGYAEAQFQLGWMYANGRGVAHDDSVAAVIFAMAARQGDRYAARMLRYVQAPPGTPLPRCLRPAPPAIELEPVGADVAIQGHARVRALVYRLAPQFGVDPQLALAVIAAESDFNRAARSPKGAEGLMQLIPQTAERFRVKRIWDPRDNIRGGLAYLRWLSAYFRGDVALVLAAYNAGEGAVDRYRGIPPYPETRNYVDKITHAYNKRTIPFDPEVADPSPIVSGGHRGQR